MSAPEELAAWFTKHEQKNRTCGWVCDDHVRSSIARSRWALVLLVAGCLLNVAPVTAEEAARFVHAWGQHGKAPGEFDFPIGIVITPTDEILVTDFYNARVQRFDTSGKFISAFDVAPFPGGIALDAPGEIYVAHGGIPPSKYDKPRQRDQIAVYEASGKLLRAWGKFGTGDGEFDLPGGIAISNHDPVLVWPEHLLSGRDGHRGQGQQVDGRNRATMQQLVALSQ